MSGYTFDFNRAKTLGNPREVVDYLRHTAKTNANWEDIDKIISQTNPNSDKDSATLDYLSNLKGFEVLESGFSEEDAKAQIHSLQTQAAPQGFAQQAKEIGSRVVSALDTIAPVSQVVNPLFFDNDKDYQARKDKSLQAAQLAQDFGLDSSALDAQTQATLIKEEGLEFADIFKPFTSDEQRAEQILSKRRARDAMLSKDFEQLSEEEKQIFRSDEGGLNRAWDSLFKDDEEAFEDYKEKLKAKRVISQTLQDKITSLNMISEGKSIRDIFLGDESTKQKYLDDVAELSGAVGFDSAGFDERGDLYLVKNNQKFKVNEGFFDNFFTSLNAIKGEVAGGIAGSVQGFKVGKTPQGKVLGAIAGGAIGSMLGASADVLAANAYLDRDNTARELIGHSLEAGLMSVAGDGVVLGVQKFGGKALKGAMQKSAKLLDDTAIGGLLRNIPSQNLRGAQKILSQSYTDAEKQSLKDFAQEFGGALEVESPSIIKQLKDSLQTRQMPFKDSALRVLDALDKPTLKARQLELIEQIRADKSGGSLSFLLEAANKSPQVSKNLKDILNQTTLNLEKSLSALGLDEVSMQAVFKTLQQETKKAYNEAMDLTLAKLYDESYKTTLDPAPYREFVESLKTQGLLQEAKPFLNFIESNVFNSQGVTFTQLENARKLLNSYVKKTDDPNLKDHIQRSIERNLRQSIQRGIDDIFTQNKQLYQEARNLYENALSDYAVMKETLSLASVKKAMDAKTQETEATNAILKYIKGQGSDGLSNLNKLKAGLGTQGVEDLELGILSNVFKQSLVQEDGLKVLDSKAFKAQLEGISGQFQSKKAQEALNILEGFHKLFLNDGALAWELKAPSTYKEGSGLATSIGGAIKQKSVKIAFLNLLRLLPDVGIPLTPIKFNTFNEATQGASLRFHIHQALKQSVNVQDFKTNLTKRASKGHFNSATNTALKNFVAKLDAIYNDTLSDLSAQNQKLEQKETKRNIADFGQNYPQFYHKGSEAINHLLRTQSGQVQGAFYKEGLGDITLAWGDDKFGLNHILKRRTEDFMKRGLSEKEARQKSLEFAQEIPQIIKKGRVRNGQSRAFIDYENKSSVIALDYKGENNKWIITTYHKEDAPISAYSHQNKHNTNTSSETRASGDHNIIPKSSAPLQPRANTLPSFKPDEIIDVEFIAREPDIKKRIEYKRHNARAKNIQKHQADTLSDLSAQNQKLEQKETRGVYNVAYNGKNATLIRQDLENVENAIAFTQGTRYKGAKHERIKHLTDPTKEGYITDLELVNLGKDLREFLKQNKPFIDTNGARIYEWENKENVRFRVVINNIADMDSNPTTATKEIITFYSDRNLKEPMSFKNPSLKQSNDTLSDLSAQNQKLEQKETRSYKQQEQITQEIKNIIDSAPQKGRDMVTIGQENFTPEVVKYAQVANKKVAIEKLSENEAINLGFKYPQDVRVTIDSSAINHTLKRHGKNSPLVKESGQKPIDYDDIAQYLQIAKNADETLQSIDSSGNNVVVSYKQINGHYIVVEQIKKKNNELGFKTLFKENGDYKQGKSYKDTRAKAQTPSIGYEPSANSFALTDDIIPKSSAPLQPRANTLPSFKPDEIIDVEFIAREPDIKKRIEYKRHNARAKNIQKHQADTLSDLSAQNQKLEQKETRGIDSATNKGFQISKENAIKELDALQREPIPQSITKEEFLKKGLKEVINKENFLKHLENKPDSFNRLKYLNLVEPTIQRANIELTQGNKKGYIKAFETDNKNLFYVLVSDNGDKLLITGIPTTKKREVIRQIKKADSITRRDPFGEVSYPPEPLKDKSPTPSGDYTTQAQPLQELQSKAHLQPQEQSFAIPRANTLPSFKPDEIIDVEFIAREPDIKKRIEYKRHNARAKNIQDLQTQLKQIDAQAIKEVSNGDSAGLFRQKYQNTENKLQKLMSASILDKIKQFDLSHKSNAHSKQKIIISKVNEEESLQLQKEFNFRGKKPLVREIDSHQIIHTLKKHGDHSKEQQRGQIAINLEDIANYEYFTKNNDLRITQDNNRIIYAKQINGHYVVVEEVLEGQDKLRFFDMWKGKGQINKGVLLSHSQRPNTIPSQNLESPMIETLTTIIPQIHQKELYDSITHDSKLNHSSSSDDTLYPLSRSHSQERGGVELDKGARETQEIPQSNLSDVKAKTIQAVEHYAQSAEFKALSAEKQNAILSLKEIEPAPMPEKITTQDLDNLTKHFNSKQDKSEREYYLKLFDDTKESPHILLETLGKNGERRKEYIKAYQHTQNKDLYYIAITQENDKINITAFPTTQARKVINDIQKSERILSGGSLGDTTNRQADKVQSPKLANDIIPQTKTKDKLEKDIAKYEERIRILDGKLSSAGEVARKNYNANFAEKEHYQGLLFKAQKAYYDIPEPSEDLPYRKFFKAQSKNKLEDIFSSAEEAMKPENLKEFLHKRGNEYYLEDFKKYLFDPHSLGFKHEIEMAQKNIILLKRYTRAPYLRELELRNGAEFRAEIEQAFDLHPSLEFGTNYAEFYHDGKGAIEKLIAESKDFAKRKEAGDISASQEFSGQVAGAFYRKDLQELSGNGEIDLVWGDSSFGLKHILDKHAKDFSDIAQELSEIVERGELKKAKDNKYTLKTQKHTLVLGQRENNGFIITAYKDRRNEKLGNHQTVVGDDFTDEPLAKTPLSSNQYNIIPQTKDSTSAFFKELKNGDKFFKDEAGKTHKLSKETQELWLKTFNLKSLDEDFIPHFSQEVKKALDSALKGKEIKINQKDLLKIAQKGREKYIKEILPTFQEPNAIFKDEKGDLIFAKKIDNRLFFANITREYDKEFLNVSLSPKKDNALKSKLENAKEVYYQKSDSELRDSSAHKASTGVLSSTNKSDNAIIPQKQNTLTQINAIKSQLIRGFGSFFDNNFISKSSFAKYKNLGIDKFFSDFQIANVHNLGFNRQYAQRIGGALTNGKTFEIIVDNPALRSGNFTRTAHFSIADTQGNVEKELIFKQHLYQDAREVINNGISIDILKDNKQKSLKYSTNAKSANLQINHNQKSNKKINLLELGNDSDFNAFLKLEQSGDNPAKRIYKGFVIEDKQNLQGNLWETLGLESRNLNEIKEIINEIHEPFSVKESQTALNALKDAKLNGDDRVFDYPNKQNFASQKEKVIFKNKMKLAGFEENPHFLHNFKNLTKINTFLKENGEPFGINFVIPQYQENKGIYAINTLLNAKIGQVKGAFYRKDLQELSGNGEIDLVWGEITDKANHKGYGLAHILDKHPELDLNLIPEIVEKGEVSKTHNGFNILYNDYLVGINAGFRKNGEKISNNNFIVTAFENLKRETNKTASADDFTKGASLPLNSDNIIPQTKDSTSAFFKELKNGDKFFKDEAGKTHKLSKETQELWLKTFNLKSLDEDFIPQFSKVVQEALGGKEIKLTQGSLLKLRAKNRTQYIPQIKETLENPDFILRDTDNMLILAKEIDNKQYFTSINLEAKDYFISISNAPKKLNILKNKVRNGAEVIYQSPNAKSIFYTETLLQPNKSLGNKIDKEIIPQIKAKFKFSEAKARDLVQWHKDSAPITKDAQGLPKVFYHGSGGYGFEEFKYGSDELGKQGFYFSSSKKVANTYNIWDENPLYEVFLNIKNPYIADFKGNAYNSKFGQNLLKELWAMNLHQKHDGVIFKSIRDEVEQGSGDIADTIVVFNPNQIKAVENIGAYKDSKGGIIGDSENAKEALEKGKDSRDTTHSYFNESSSNIYQSNPHIGAGLLGGSVAGIEEDEQGNLSFDPAKFALGFLGGAVGSKGLAKGHNRLEYLRLKKKEKEELRILRDFTKKRLSEIKNQDIVNKSGTIARLSSVGIAKMSSDKAIQKSINNGFNTLEHFEAVNNIKNLFTKSEFLRSERANNQSQDIVAVHRFIAKDALKNKDAQALITLKESMQHGKRIYSLELEELKPALPNEL